MHKYFLLKSYNFFFVAIIALLLGGCSVVPNSKFLKNSKKCSIYDNKEKTNFTTNEELSLFEDYQPHNVGDTMTVVLEENVSASNSSSENIAKEGDSYIAMTPFPNPIGIMHKKNIKKNEFNGETKNNYSGLGNSTSKNILEGVITVTINEILSNGNLKVEGEKRITINKGTEYIKFTGIVNPRTIDKDNSVISTQIANANIEYVNNNYTNSINKMGWLQRWFFKIWPL
ncbi:Flagellar L-ring protein [Buchnera aphidicola (Tetraneura ulmi)]|uniref:flagellar basal body L-ring protein FlgH n=1 Tax=Buchnera aphidicola TaxID=9 RepID=UPI0034648C09